MTTHAQRAPLLNKIKDKMHRKISETGLDATIRYELHTRLEGMPTHNKVCHGDFNPTNIIINNEGIPYILDWSHVTQGNASADVARTYLLFHLANEVENANKYLNLFCKKVILQDNMCKNGCQLWLHHKVSKESLRKETSCSDGLMLLNMNKKFQL